MKRWTYFLFIQTIALTLFATEPKVKLTWSDEYQVPKNYRNLGFIGSPEIGYTHITHEYGKNLKLFKFSPTLKLESEKNIDLKSFPKDYFSEYFLKWNKKHYWFYTTWDKKEGKERLFVQNVDAVKGNLSGSPKEIISCAELRGEMYNVGPYKYSKGDKFTIKFSSDSSKMFVYAIYTEPVIEDKKKFIVYGLWVFDKDMNLLWSKPTQKMPRSHKQMLVSDIYVDNDGSFLFLSEMYENDVRAVVVTRVEKKVTNVKDNQPESHYEITKFSKDGVSTLEKFDFKEKAISKILLTKDLNKDWICVGYYSNRDKNGQLTAYSGRVDGCFIKKIGSDASLKENFYEVPDEVIKSFEKSRVARKIEKGIEQGEDQASENILLRKIVFNADGSTIVIGEEYFMRLERIRTADNSELIYHYYYGDVLVQYIGADGKQRWVRKVPKNQYGRDTDWGLSIRHLNYRGNNYLFFLDNMNNIVLNNDEFPAKHTAGWGGVMMAVRLNEVGDVKKSVVFDTREIKTDIDIFGADEVGEGILIDRALAGSSRNAPSKVCLIQIVEE